MLTLTHKWEGLPGPKRSATESKPQWAAPQAGRPTHEARQHDLEVNTTGDPSCDPFSSTCSLLQGNCLTVAVHLGKHEHTLLAFSVLPMSLVRS